MGHATESLERAEHTSHAGHGGHHAEPDPKAARFAMGVGITMAMLGVLLAFAAAKVGGERTELIRALVEQQHAHAKYQAQDIKHRATVLSLRQMHATAEQGKVNAADMVLTAKTVERYRAEAEEAQKWVDSFDPAIEVHTEGQEEYELAQLAAEFGIVVASVALLLRRRAAWFAAIGLGLVAIGLLGLTYLHEHKRLHSAEAQIEETEKEYRELRAQGKTGNNVDQLLVDEVIATYGGKVTPQ